MIFGTISCGAVFVAYKMYSTLLSSPNPYSDWWLAFQRCTALADLISIVLCFFVMTAWDEDSIISQLLRDNQYHRPTLANFVLGFVIFHLWINTVIHQFSMTRPIGAFQIPFLESCPLIIVQKLSLISFCFSLHPDITIMVDWA